MEQDPPGYIDPGPPKKKGGKPKGYTHLAFKGRMKERVQRPENPHAPGTRIDGATLMIPMKIKTLDVRNNKKFDGDMVQTVLNVFNFLGGEQFLADWAAEYPTLFMTHMIAKMLPKDINIKKTSRVDGEMTITKQVLAKLTMEQLQELESLSMEPNQQEPECQTQPQDTMPRNSIIEADMTEVLPGSLSGSDLEQSDTTSAPLQTKD